MTNMVRRRFDIAGTALFLDRVRWRKLRSFQLVPGAYEAPTRAIRLRDALKAHLDESFASIRAVLPSESDGTASRLSKSLVHEAERSSAPRAPIPVTERLQSDSTSSGASDSQVVLEGLLSCTLSQPPHVIVDLTTVDSGNDINGDAPEDGEDGGEDGEGAAVDGEDNSTSTDVPLSPPWSRNKLRRMESIVEAEVTDAELRAATGFVETVPTRWQRQKRRHQKKVKAGEWTQPRSRKRRHQRLCGVTRSGSHIYHVHSTKTKKFKATLRIPGLRKRLRELHQRRSTYEEPPTSGYFLPIEVQWPENVMRIEECSNPENVKFPDIGDFGRCSCTGDCFMDTCENTDSALYCTPTSCNLDGKCSNAPKTLQTLKLFDTGRVGTGVFTTTDLCVGDVIGEYAGELSAYDPIITGMPGQKMKQNTGYTMLLNAKSRNNKYVYLEAHKCGSITRFISHSCTPNATFVELQNRANVKVLVRMIESVHAGAQITVNYGNQTWFNCACDQCWSEEDGSN